MITYRAKWIMPICSPIIEDGWVSVEHDQIVSLGKDVCAAPTKPVDLGEVVLLPALLNAHTHLEFSDLLVPIGQAGIRLHQWIGEVIQCRSRKDANAEPTSSAIAKGLKASHQFGVGLVCDIATTPVNLPPLPGASIPEVISLAEVLGLSKDRSESKLQLAEEYLSSNAQTNIFTPAISPHAPYSTPLHVIDRCVQLAKQHQALLAMHVAESPEERQLIEQGEGPFADTLRSMQLYDEKLFPWGKDAMHQLLKRLSIAPRVLLIHGNDLQPDEIAMIATYPNLSVVYCPRTHAFFGHPRHPFAEMLAGGINVALGTDSLASNPDLSVWREVQWLVKHRQDVSWKTILQMATMNAADAVGRSDLGRLAPHKKARLLTLPVRGRSIESIANALITQEPRWLIPSM